MTTKRKRKLLNNCDHTQGWDPVLTADGREMARQCRACLAYVQSSEPEGGWALCKQCGTRFGITIVQLRVGKKYCSDVCQRASAKMRRGEDAAAMDQGAPTAQGDRGAQTGAVAQPGGAAR